MSREELVAIERVAELQPVSDGDVVFQAGDAADAMYFVLAGSVSVRVPLASGRSRRLSTLGAGVAFGEMAILDNQPRSADIVADGHGALARLSVGRPAGACHRAPEPCGDALPQPLGRALASASQCERSGSGARPVAGDASTEPASYGPRRDQAATRATRSMTS